MRRQEKLETTLGNLIFTLTEETTRFVHDEKEAYKIVAWILTDLSRNTGMKNGYQRRLPPSAARMLNM